jgi:predicted transcriptional regulator
MAGVVVNWRQRYDFLVRLPKEKLKILQNIDKMYKKQAKNLVVLPRNSNFAGKNV